MLVNVPRLAKARVDFCQRGLDVVAQRLMPLLDFAECPHAGNHNVILGRIFARFQ